MYTFRKRLWQEKLFTFRHYYRFRKFALLDIGYSLIFLFFNPYRALRKSLQKEKAEEIYAYGETPYSTYEKIATEVNITPSDTWIEVGSGMGKGCFWLSCFTGCKVIGVEKMKSFVFFSRLIQRLFRIKGTLFLKGDIEKVKLSQADFIYLYGVWPKNTEAFGDATVISISEPLEGCVVEKGFWVRFPWGRTRAYVQKRIDSKKALPL